MLTLFTSPSKLIQEDLPEIGDSESLEWQVHTVVWWTFWSLHTPYLSLMHLYTETARQHVYWNKKEPILRVTRSKRAWRETVVLLAIYIIESWHMCREVTSILNPETNLENRKIFVSSFLISFFEIFKKYEFSFIPIYNFCFPATYLEYKQILHKHYTTTDFVIHFSITHKEQINNSTHILLSL